MRADIGGDQAAMYSPSVLTMFVTRTKSAMNNRYRCDRMS